jgi:hypothetical protein
MRIAATESVSFVRANEKLIMLPVPEFWEILD